jgi:hypothetical protein
MMRGHGRFQGGILALTLAALLGGCGGDSAPTTPAGANVTVEAARRATATIGPEGGSVSATSGAGTAFRLDVPAGALPAPIEIAMTPISAIDGLPYSGGLTGAVQLEPSGLVLVKPAMLTIGTAADLAGEQRLVGFNFQGDADAFAPTAASDGSGGIRVPVPHFSGAGAAAAAPGDPDYDYCTDPDIGLRIVCIAPADPERRDKFLTAAREYLNDIVVPDVRGDTNLGLRDAIITRYLRWYSFVDHFAAEYQAADWPDVLAAEHAAARDLIAARLREAIAALKEDLCTSRRDIETLIAVFEFDWLAQATGLNTSEDGLTGEQTLAGLCAEIVIESFRLPDPMPVGQDVSVDVDLRLDLGGVPVEAPFQVNLWGNLDLGEDFARCCGRTNANGGFTTVAKRVIDGAVVLHMNAFLLLPLFSPQGGLTLAEVPVQTTAALFRGSTTLLVDFPANVIPGAPALLGVVVSREVAAGTFEPLANALVTCAVTGGSADPAIAITDSDGIARTMITADAGIDSVLVQFTVNDNGVDVGRGRAAARAIGDGEGGTITLIRQLSEAVATIPQNSNCDSDNGADLSQNIGAVSLSAAAAQACRAEDPDVGYLAGITASCFTSLNADTGLAPDGRSAVMTFASSGSSNIVGEGEGTGYLFTHASLYVEFQIQGGPMAFQLEGLLTAENDGDIDVTLYNADWAVLYEWDKQFGDNVPSAILVAGNLPPGRYHGQVVAGGRAGWPSRPTANYSGQVTLTLSQP